MSDETDEFGDVEVILRAWAKPLLTGVRIVSELPGDLAGSVPLLQIVRASGDDPRAFMATDRAVVDVDAWQGTRTDALALAETARRYLRRDLPGTTTGGFVFTWVTTVVAPRWQADPNTNVRRFTATYELGLNPA